MSKCKYCNKELDLCEMLKPLFSPNKDVSEMFLDICFDCIRNKEVKIKIKKELKRYIKEQNKIIKSYELAIDTLVDKVNVYKDNVYRVELELKSIGGE